MQTKLIFDADCVLCSGWVHFILHHERDQSIIFINAWSGTGAALAKEHGLNQSDLQKTFLVIENGKGLMRSDAVLALVAHLKFPYSAMRGFRFVPRFIRDGIYGFVARNRYRWFGRQEKCFVPPVAQRERFIDS